MGGEAQFFSERMCKKIRVFAGIFTDAPGGWYAGRPAALSRGLRRASPPCSRTGADTEGHGETKPRFYRGCATPEGTGLDRERHPVAVRLRSAGSASRTSGLDNLSPGLLGHEDGRNRQHIRFALESDEVHDGVPGHEGGAYPFAQSLLLPIKKRPSLPHRHGSSSKRLCRCMIVDVRDL